VAAASRPLRTITALAKLFGHRWNDLTRLEANDNGISLSFAEPPPVVAMLPEPMPQPLPPAPDKPIPEPQLNDADLALSPPAGMLAPPPPDEPN